MTDLRIVDAPELTTIEGDEKIPTGNSGGNFAIVTDALAQFVKDSKDLQSGAEVDAAVAPVEMEVSTHIADLANPHQVTKDQVGLGNVDNTADADKPISSAVAAAITTLTTNKADKTYVDSQLALKADKLTTYTKTEVDTALSLKANQATTYTKTEVNTLLENKQERLSIGGTLTGVNSFDTVPNLDGLDGNPSSVMNQQAQALMNRTESLNYDMSTMLNYYDASFSASIGGYPLNSRVVLSNGELVVSTIPSNTNDPNVNMTGWVKPEKIFNIEYFGGVADYDETTKTILTDSGDALREAIVEAKKVMGCVYIPSSPKGKAFYASGNFNLSVDGFTEGVRVIGDGKIASKLYASPIDVTKPIFGGETGAPGNPTNISISGMSLISHEKWVGTCLQFNGACITEIPDLYIKDFDCNIEFVNDTLAPNGIFTEFVRVSNSHLRNGKTNLRFRRRNNGDASFHGVNFSGLSMDGTDEAGQIGIDIGEGCYIYSASWSQVNIFSTGEGIALKNAGNRNGFDELYFEGNGRVENTSTGTWNTDGRWFVQNDTGSFDDRSVGNTQFITGNYQTSKNNTSADFTNLGLSEFRAGTGDTARKKLTRVFGNGIEGFSLNFFTGNDNSWSGTQGLALTYSTNNDQNSKPDGIACYLTLNRFSSFLSEYNFSYKQGTPQLTINSSGRHTGRMGRYKSVVVPISSSGQTVTITGLMPTTQQSVLISIDCSANNISYSALYLCSKWDGATTTGVLIGISRFENMPSGISQVYTNDGGLNIVFDSAVNVSLNMNISVVGIGIY